jgi:hypothetical protein
MTNVQTSTHRRATGAMLSLIAILALFGGMAVVEAQSPPGPPSRFVGSVTVNGQPAAAGTVIEARIGDASCGTATVFLSGSEARYSLDSPGADPAGSPDCGTDGDTVTFIVGGTQANETGTWRNFDLNTVNLTVSSAVATPTVPAATPTTATGATATATTGGGGGAVTPTSGSGGGGGGVATATPRPPSTGNGQSSGGGSSLALWLSLGVLLAGGATGAGLTVARKR